MSHETPPEDAPRRALLHRFLFVVLGVAGVAVSARLSLTIPGSSVPQSAQTLAVLLVGGLLGARDGALCLAAYLVAGALGVPVFADGGAGWQHLVGPTSGYLAGFVVAAAVAGLTADLGRLDRVGWALGTMVACHVLILGLGWGRLAVALGGAEAWQQGVAPFVLGGVLKSLVAALVVMAFWTWRAAPDMVVRDLDSLNQD